MLGLAHDVNALRAPARECTRHVEHHEPDARTQREARADKNSRRGFFFVPRYLELGQRLLSERRRRENREVRGEIASDSPHQNKGGIAEPPHAYVPPTGPLGELFDLLNRIFGGGGSPGGPTDPDSYVPFDETKPVPEAGGAGAKKPPGSTRFELVTAPNWRSRPQFGHTFSLHGQGDKITRSLVGRAAGTGTPQGQWLNNDAAARWIADKVRTMHGSAAFRLPGGMGQVVMPNGQIVAANAAEIWLTPAGTVRSAFPILIP